MCKIFSNSATEHLFSNIKRFVNEKDKLSITKFSDGEISVKFENTIRGQNIFILADTSKNLTELLLTLDAAKRASAKSITVILPYYGYGRQDKREGNRGCLGAKMVANVLSSLYVDRIITIDLHAEQIQGFFNIPCEHINGSSFMLEAIKEIITPETVLCSPDAGGITRVLNFNSKLGLPVVSINKLRERPNEVKSMDLIGSVEGKDVILIDDMIDTGGKVKKATALLFEKGAKSVSMLATHPILSGNAKKNLLDSNLKNLIISDTVKYELGELPGINVKIVSCTPIIEKVINNLLENSSLSSINL